MQRLVSPQSRCRRVAIAVRGVVQGVGFRPFVYNSARARALTGWVRNEADTVRIEVQGESVAVDSFLEALSSNHPPQARIDALEIADLPCQDGQSAVFEIRSSSEPGTPRPTIPADLATCAECLAEIRTARRAALSLSVHQLHELRAAVVDHRATALRPAAHVDGRLRHVPRLPAEYENPADRRFHAQPIACPQCGPALELLDADGRRMAAADEALEQAASAVLDGQILALKGLGGFQLLVDATNAAAVTRLRDRKRRPDKPFALMFASLDEVRRYCQVSDDEARVLASHQAPILLLPRRRGDSRARIRAEQNIAEQSIAAAVAPGNPVPGRDASLHAAAPPAHGVAGRPDRLHQRQPLRRADGDCHRRRAGASGRDRRRASSFTTGRSSGRSTIRWLASARGRSRCCAAPGDSPRCRSNWAEPDRRSWPWAGI